MLLPMNNAKDILKNLSKGRLSRRWVPQKEKKEVALIDDEAERTFTGHLILRDGAILFHTIDLKSHPIAQSHNL